MCLLLREGDRESSAVRVEGIAEVDLDWSPKMSVAEVLAALTSLKSSESSGFPCRKTSVLFMNSHPSAFLYA